MGLLIALFFIIFQNQAFSHDIEWKHLTCTNGQRGSYVTLKIDWKKLRTFRILNGADYFDARQENNAVHFELKTNSQKLIKLSPEEGFSYFDEDNLSIIVGKTNEEYKDLLNLEIFLRPQNILMGKIYLMNEENKMTSEDLECRK
jgi:hypothetical protein